MTARRMTARAAALLAALACAACGPSAPAPASAPPASAPVTHAIEGQVRLRGAESASGVQVFVPGASYLSMTDDAGNFRLSGLAPGRYQVAAQKAGYIAASVGEIDIPDADRPGLFMLPAATLEPAETAAPAPPEPAAGALRGRIRNAHEDPEAGPGDLSGCKIELAGTEMRTFTGPDGEFLLWNVPAGDYTLTAELDGFQPKEAGVTVAAGTENPQLVIILNPVETELSRREILGTIELRPAEGEEPPPLDAIEIALAELPDLKPTLGEDGAFRFGPLAAQVYTLRAAAEGYVPVEALAVDLRKARSANIPLVLNALEAEARPPGRVVGAATKNDPEARDMSGITVALAGTSYVAVTDREGNYAIAGVEPGVYQLVIQAEGFETQTLDGLEVADGEEAAVDPVALEPVREYPVVLESSPAPGERGVMLKHEMPVFIRFSKKMKPETLRESVRIAPDVEFDLLAGKEGRQTDFDLLQLVLFGASEARPMKFDTNYRITVGTGATDFEGLQLEEPYVINFRTGKAALVDTIPPNGADNFPAAPFYAVRVRFNARIDPKTLRASDIEVKPMQVVPTLQIVDSPETGWTEVHIQSVWEQDTEYRIKIGRGLRTTTRQPISNLPYTFRFRTEKMREFPGLLPAPR